MFFFSFSVLWESPAQTLQRLKLNNQHITDVRLTKVEVDEHFRRMRRLLKSLAEGILTW